MSVDTLPPAIARLGLEAPEALLRPAAPGTDGAAILQALQAAMHEQLAPGAPVTAAQRQQVLLAAGRRLLARPETLKSALHLAEHAGREATLSAPFVNLRIVALERLKDRGGLIRALNRIIAARPMPEAVAQLVVGAAERHDIRQLFALPGRLHAVGWGAWSDDLPAQLDALAGVTPSPAVSEAAIEHLFRHSRAGIRSYDEYRTRLLHGVNLGRYLFYLRNRTSALGSAPEGAQTTAEDQRIAQRWRAIDGLLQLPDVALLQAAEARGQTLLMLGSHGGANALLGRSMDGCTLPRSSITQNVSADREGSFNISTLAPDATLRFAKLIKMARRSPRMVFMFPDGAVGDTTAIEVQGRKLHIGRGAASLAWFTRALPFFARTVIEDGAIVLRLLPGPEQKDGEEMERYEKRLNAFYAECLRDILAGPPENIGDLVNKFNPPK